MTATPGQRPIRDVSVIPLLRGADWTGNSRKRNMHWSAGDISAVCASVVAVIGSVTALVRLLQHKNDPAAHSNDKPPSAA